MPWTEKQEHLFQMIAHGGKPTKTKTSLTPAKASEMLSHAKKAHEYGSMLKKKES